MQKNLFESSVSSIMLASEAFSRLTLTDDVLDTYLTVRETLCEVIEGIVEEQYLKYYLSPDDWDFWQKMKELAR